MKKLIAVVLAALMLLASVAMAESGTMSLIELSNLNVAGMDLQGFEAKVAMGDGSAQAEIVGNGESLLTLIAQLADGKMVLGGDLANTYAVDLAAQGMPAEAMDVLPQLFNLGVLLKDFTLPAYPGIDLPMLPIATLLGSVGGTATEDGGVRLDISSEQVMGALDMIMSLAESNAGSLSGQMDQVKQAVNSLKESGVSVELSVQAKDSADASDVDVFIIPVEQEGAWDTHIARLHLTSKANVDILTVYLNMDNTENQMAIIELDSDPAAPSLTLTANLADTVDFVFALTNDDGIQNCVLSADASGNGATLRLSYGPQDGRDLVELNLAVPQTGEFNFRLLTAADTEGNREGELLIDAAGIQISGTVRSIVEADVTVPVLDASNAIDLTADGAADQLQSDLSQAVNGVVGYLSNIAA